VGVSDGLPRFDLTPSGFFFAEAPERHVRHHGWLRMAPSAILRSPNMPQRLHGAALQAHHRDQHLVAVSHRTPPSLRRLRGSLGEFESSCFTGFCFSDDASVGVTL
jgi:hypothetical protein